MKKYNYDEMIGGYIGDRKLLSIERKDGRIYLTCECRCGKIISGMSYIIQNNKNRPCKSCRQFKHKLEGTKINNWLVIKRDPANLGKFICKCLGENCNLEHSIKCNDLIKNNTRSCIGCCNRGKKRNKFAFKGYKNISGKYFGQIKNTAKKRNREFSISIEYISNLFDEQNKVCPYTKIILNLNKDLGETTASLDRKDSSKGYIEGNVQWVFRPINFMKQDLTEKQFIEYCALIVYNQNKNLQHQIIPLGGI